MWSRSAAWDADRPVLGPQLHDNRALAIVAVVGMSNAGLLESHRRRVEDLTESVMRDWKLARAWLTREFGRDKCY